MAKAHILYLSYNGLAEPLGRRQVLPYIVGLAARGHRFKVISFEKPGFEPHAQRVRDALQGLPVMWTPLLYHSRPTVPATLFDMLHGSLRGLVTPSTFDLFHARSTVPATMAATLARLLGRPWIFDVRGLVAQEYVDAGHWREGSWLHRLTDRVERSLLRRAGGLVFLTSRIRDELASQGATLSSIPAEVIPCCVDLEVFRASAQDRGDIRSLLSMRDEPLLVYAGSLGSWYRIEEMTAFFATARLSIPGLRFLVLTSEPERAARAAQAAGVTDAVTAFQVPPDDVPRHLAAADAGLCFLSNSPSKNASSPTKYAEYLATGLPVVTNPWTGDARELSGERSWILVGGFTQADYRRGAERLREVLADPNRRAQARQVAETRFSLASAVDRYEALYSAVVGRAR